MWLLNVAMAANPVGAVVAALGILIASMIYFEQRTGYLSAAWRSVVGVFTDTPGWIKELFRSGVAGVPGVLAGKIMGLVRGNDQGGNEGRLTNFMGPGLPRGGRVTGAGTALVGERGPELLHLSPGAVVQPLSTNDVPSNLGGVNITLQLAGVDLVNERRVGDILVAHIQDQLARK